MLRTLLLASAVLAPAALTLGSALPAHAQLPTSKPTSGPIPAIATPASPAPAPATAPATGPAAGAATNAPAMQSKLGKEKADRVEKHIAELHRVLKITPAQETLWQNFAAAMRDNATQMDQVYAQREQAIAGMNAVQNLESYGEVENTMAQNVQKLLPPFQALYDSFSPDQKKTADSTFQRYTNRAVRKAG